MTKQMNKSERGFRQVTSMIFVLVCSVANGEILFHDDFESGTDGWEVSSGPGDDSMLVNVLSSPEWSTAPAGENIFALYPGFSFPIGSGGSTDAMLHTELIWGRSDLSLSLAVGRDMTTEGIDDIRFQGHLMWQDETGNKGFAMPMNIDINQPELGGWEMNSSSFSPRDRFTGEDLVGKSVLVRLSTYRNKASEPVEYGDWTGFDGVSISAVPEPSSCLCLLVACLCIGGRQRVFNANRDQRHP